MEPVFTIESVALTVWLETEKAIVIFQVVHNNYLISESEIVGASFLENNGINMDFRTSTLSRVLLKHSGNPSIPELLVIQPKKETLIHIITDEIDGITLIIHA